MTPKEDAPVPELPSRPPWVSYLVLVANSFTFSLLNYLALKLIFRNSAGELGELRAIIFIEATLFISAWVGSIISYFVLERKLHLQKSNIYFLILIVIAFPAVFFPLIVGLAARDRVTHKLSIPTQTVSPPTSTEFILPTLTEKITPKLPGNQISSVKIASSEYSLRVTTTSGDHLIDINGLGIKNPPCLQNPKYRISDSKTYMAFQDISGGIDSMIRIYSAQQNEAVQLDVYGTSSIFDFVFLPGDYLAVMSGYPNILEEQYLTIYNIPGLYKNYPAGLHPEYKAFTTALNGNKRSVEIPTLTERVNNFRVTNDRLEILGVPANGPKILARLPLNEITRFDFIVGQDQAALLVYNLPDVKDFLKRVSKGHVVLDHEDITRNVWVVHVYEDLPDHTATFNWYYVDKTTGEVSKEFNF